MERSKEVRCSECGETYRSRGFGTHNSKVHDGEATAKDIDTDTMSDDDSEPDDTDEQPTDDTDDIDPFDSGQNSVETTFNDDTEVDGDPDAGDVTDDIDDTEDDARDYACGNCGHGLEYLGGVDRDGGGKECPECGERLFWSKIPA